MITCRLNVILAEKRKTRAWLSELAHISYNSLRPFHEDNWKGIRRETINKLCKALGITPGDLFEYVPDD